MCTYSTPIKASTHGLQLFLHFPYVRSCPFRWIYTSFDSRIFSWQSERVPTHGMKNIVALHALEPGQNVRDRVDSEMANVKGARRVGEHW